jgi:hypothetical protein
MINIGIGIDCSGFVCHILESRINLGCLKFTTNNVYSRFIRSFRLIQNISANDLTSSINTDIVENLNEVQVYDLIRSHGLVDGGMHVALITNIVKDSNNNVIEFEYVHSTRWYEEENGVRTGKIIIVDPLMDLSQQEWRDEINGRNYFKEEFVKNIEDSGVRRLKCIK